MNPSLRISQPAGCLRADMKFAALLALAALLFTVAALTQDKGPCSNVTSNGEHASYISGIRSFAGITLSHVVSAVFKRSEPEHA